LGGAEVGAGEGADLGEGCVGLGEGGGEEVEDVPELGPDLERDVDAGGAGSIGEAGGVGEEDLVVADVDEERGEAAVIGEEGGEAGVAAVVLADVVAGDGIEQGRSEPGVDGGAVLDALAAEGEVGEGREEDGGGGQRVASVAEGVEDGEGEAAARGVADAGAWSRRCATSRRSPRLIAPHDPFDSWPGVAL
jgi:hypothetical protein